MDTKPWWRQRTLWTSAAGFCTAIAAILTPDSRVGIALLALAAVFSNIGSITARMGGVAAAQTVVDSLPPPIRAAVEEAKDRKDAGAS